MEKQKVVASTKKIPAKKQRVKGEPLTGGAYTDWLVKFLQKKYPAKNFVTINKKDLHLEEAIIPFRVICFHLDEVSVMYDPFQSFCMRFPADPLADYGIDRADANKIYEHNFPSKKEKKKKEDANKPKAE